MKPIHLYAVSIMSFFMLVTTIQLAYASSKAPTTEGRGTAHDFGLTRPSFKAVMRSVPQGNPAWEPTDARTVDSERFPSLVKDTSSTNMDRLPTDRSSYFNAAHAAKNLDQVKPKMVHFSLLTSNLLLESQLEKMRAHGSVSPDYSSAKRKENFWVFINQHQPDLMCLQECDAYWVTFLDENFSDEYDFFSLSDRLVNLTIAFRKSAFSVSTEGTQGHQCWVDQNASTKKTAKFSHITLVHNDTGILVDVVNLHVAPGHLFTIKDPLCYTLSARPHSVKIVAGDFNTLEPECANNVLIQQLFSGWRNLISNDSLRTLVGRELKKQFLDTRVPFDRILCRFPDTHSYASDFAGKLSFVFPQEQRLLLGKTSPVPQGAAAPSSPSRVAAQSTGTWSDHRAYIALISLKEPRAGQ